MDFIQNLSEEAKVAVGLVIAEKMFHLIDRNESGYKIGREALDSCWKWLEGEKVTADDLCTYIDSEDFEDIAEYANGEEGLQKQYAWYSVLDAVSYTIYQAYKREERKFVPQIIEMIDDETLKILVENAMESRCLKMDSVRNVIMTLMENDSVGVDGEHYNGMMKERLMRTL
ncbi:immunity protein imm6 [Bacillus sp. 7586-K]|nr:immunity protein imm6 [Bacillus sp. 7586-K]